MERFEMTVYGPYTRKDGRKHVIHHIDGKRRTQSYPRYLMEQFLGRLLEDWETVDHVNEDPTDNRIENLQILTLPANIAKHFDQNNKRAKMLTFDCPICGASFEISENQWKNNQVSKKRSGPYCSKRCAGRAC
jgi:HNH endonuclease